MADLKLHGSLTSPFVYRVIWALKMKGLDYEFVLEDTSNKSELLLKYNPVYKKIPVLVHAGKPISESSIILEYIEETWPENPLLSKDPYKNSVARFWSKFADDKGLAVFRVFLKAGEEHEQAIQDTLDFYQILEDQALGGKKFFGGETIGLTDLMMGWLAHWSGIVEEAVGIRMLDEQKFPRLVKWTKNFKDCPVIKENLPDFNETLVYFKKRRQLFMAAATK